VTRLVMVVLAFAFLVMATHNDVSAFPENEWGFSASTNFDSFLPIGVLRELSAAPMLAGVGGFARFSWIWSLHARPWGQVYFAEDNPRLAGGFDLIWGDPKREPDLAYVGFGLMVSDFLPRPITNFMIGYSTGVDDCNLNLEARFLFLTSFQVGFGCGF